MILNLTGGISPHVDAGTRNVSLNQAEVALLCIRIARVSHIITYNSNALALVNIPDLLYQ